MIVISDENFQALVKQAVDDIPPQYAKHLANVAFMVDEMPSTQQLRSGGILHGDITLLGLYEGVPLPDRAAGYSGVVPDMITVFRRPHVMMASSEHELASSVHDTVWHEVAHYFGLDHGQINSLE